MFLLIHISCMPKQNNIYIYKSLENAKKFNLKELEQYDAEELFEKYKEVKNNLNELILNAKSKRYSYNRIQRMLLHIVCKDKKINKRGKEKRNGNTIIKMNHLSENECRFCFVSITSEMTIIVVCE